MYCSYTENNVTVADQYSQNRYFSDCIEYLNLENSAVSYFE